LVERAVSAGAAFTVSAPFAYVPEFNAYGSCAEAGGHFWVVGEEGVVHHRPRAYPRRTYEPQTFIRTVELIRRDSLIFGGTGVGTGASLPNGVPPTADAAGTAAGTAAPPVDREDGAKARRTRVRGIEMPYEDNAIRLEFAAPVFGREEKVEYQYRLVGFDAAWSTWSNETRKEYTNLPPGHYEFTVRARNARMWTAGTASYPFSVMPPWYRTVWAYGAYALVMGGLVFGVVQWRSAQLERRAERLESVVARRTAEVQEQARQLEVYNSELVRSNEVLQETVEEKSKLLGVAAHDLKNPLFGIRALSEVLLERGQFGERTTRKLNLIRESADETLRLINDLLASAAASAQAQAHVEMIDAGALAEWVAHSFEPQADRKGQRLTCEVPPTPCIVEADKRKLREAMNNLISNAIKYSPHGAAIDVSVERSGEAVRFRVADEGPGLSEEDQQRLFAPFQRLTPEPTGDEGSSGLGLYIVKQVAELHGGDVDVDSAVGEGSTFTLVIPLATGTTGAGRWG
jgi:signal transduction histidine kinase